MQQHSRYLLGLCMLAVLVGLGFRPADSTVRIACIGDSITYGAGIEDKTMDSWPAQLGLMLGKGWKVFNFGVGGATMLKNGTRPFWKEPQWINAQLINPDIVIIKLGTNDSAPRNWPEHGAEFYADYTDMIDKLRAVDNPPRIYICTPAPAFNDLDSVISGEVIPVLKRLSRENNLNIIDFHQALRGLSGLFPDEIHPNAAGARIMAQTVHGILTK
jgi:acyl-CoA thioesterase I